MTDVAIIGASGFLGRTLAGLLEARGIKVCRVTSKQTSVSEPTSLVWRYNLPPPAELLKIPIWINCAFSLQSGNSNIAIAKYLAEALTTQVLVQVSTNAVLSYDDRPENNSLKYRKGGEDYARLKSRIDRYLLRKIPAGQLSIVYPTAVIGAGGNWSATLTHAARHSKVQLPEAGRLVADWVSIADAAEQIVATALSTPVPPYVILRSSPDKTWKDLVLEHKSPDMLDTNAPKFEEIPTNRPFFDSLAKNTIFRILVSPLLPDTLSLRAFSILRSRLSPRRPKPEDPTPAHPFCPVGPSRYYFTQNARTLK